MPFTDPPITTWADDVGVTTAFLQAVSDDLFYVKYSVHEIKADPTELTDSNSAAETTMYSTTLAGGTLGINDSLAFEFYLSILNNSGGTRTLTFRLKYGATTIVTFSIGIAASATTFATLVKGYMKNAGATNSQKAIMEAIGGGASVGAAVGTAAEDSAANKTLALTLQSDAATATQTYIVQQTYIDYRRTI